MPRLSLLITLVCLMGISSSCPAAVVVTDNTGNVATQVEGIEVMNMTFDVEFRVGSFQNIFGDPTAPSLIPTFWSDLPGAEQALDAINQALNNSTATHAGSAVPPTGNLIEYLIPYTFVDPPNDPPFSRTIAGVSDPLNGWGRLIINGKDTFGAHKDLTRVYTVFTKQTPFANQTPAHMPEPTSILVWSIIGAFFCIGGYAKRPRRSEIAL